MFKTIIRIKSFKNKSVVNVDCEQCDQVVDSNDLNDLNTFISCSNNNQYICGSTTEMLTEHQFDDDQLKTIIQSIFNQMIEKFPNIGLLEI